MLLSLTQAGKRKAKDLHVKGAEAYFLVSISEGGPSTLDDIASDLHVSRKVAMKIAKRLSKAGLIKREE